MKVMGIDGVYIDSKEQLLNIYNGYKLTRPSQSNLFTNNNKCYREDLLANAENIDSQMEAIKDSLNTILQRYNYTETTVFVTFDDIDNQFLLDIDTTNMDGVKVKLSDSIILENKN